MKIHWDKSIGIGVPQLDEDHKRLIDLFNYVQTHPDLDVSSEAMSLVMEQIREYASTHFHREEKYMEQIEYPDFDNHKKAHKQFKEKSASLCLDVMHRQENVQHEIYQFLCDWIADHILRADKQIQAYRDARRECEQKTV